MLSERQENILRAVVENYISSGEPVGSKYLCTVGDLHVSSATVRNDLAALAEMGYLEQPHTSAGRVPSRMGYRYYINVLMKQSEPSPMDIFRIRSRIDQTEGDPEKLLDAAIGILSDLTGCAAVVSTPYAGENRIRRVDLVPLGGRNVMLVLTTDNGVIRSRVCRCEHEIAYDDMELFYRIVGSGFAECRMDAITVPALQSLTASLGEHAFDMAPLLTTFAAAAREAVESDVLVSGLSGLLAYRELADCAGELIPFLRKKSPVLRILRSGKGEQTGVLLGEENRFREMDNTATVFAEYKIAGHEAGTIGVIGPMRMDYAGVIPVVRYTASVIGSILEENTRS